MASRAWSGHNFVNSNQLQAEPKHVQSSLQLTYIPKLSVPVKNWLPLASALADVSKLIWPRPLQRHPIQWLAKLFYYEAKKTTIDKTQKEKDISWLFSGYRDLNPGPLDLIWSERGWTKPAPSLLISSKKFFHPIWSLTAAGSTAAATSSRGRTNQSAKSTRSSRFLTETWSWRPPELCAEANSTDSWRPKPRL